MRKMPAMQDGAKSVLTTCAFQGYNHNEIIADGELHDMMNMSGEKYPLLALRRRRGINSWDLDGQPQVPLTGIHGRDQLVFVRGNTVYWNNSPVQGITVSTDAAMCPKRIVSFGAYVLIWPDKLYFNTADMGDAGTIDRIWSGEGSTLTVSMCRLDGTDYPQDPVPGTEPPADPANGMYWLDESGENDVLRQYSAATGEWVEIATTFVKISGTGIGHGLKEYDCIEISGLQLAGQDPDAKLEQQLSMLNGSMIIYTAGDDYVVVAGLMSQAIQAGGLTGTVHADLAMPDIRRGRLKRMLEAKGLVTVMEAHDGLTGLVVENTVVHENGGARQFDAMWLSSLCDSTAKGKPDIELVDMTSRFRTIDDIMEVTTKPIIFDGDTGGLTEHFVYTVRSLERMGVSMVIIEDKTGLKKNSLFGTEVVQTQDTIETFSAKIRAGKKAQRTGEFMICARIESLILEQGMEDALTRAFAFVDAGADAIMIHSRKKDPAEIFEFLEKFREKDAATPVVLVPTSFNSVKEEEWKARGANIIIYANQLMRAAVPAIQKAAETILENHRAEECDAQLMPFKDIIRLIPEE